MNIWGSKTVYVTTYTLRVRLTSFHLGNVCFCGQDLNYVPVLAIDQTGDNNFVCPAERTQLCGGDQQLQLYKRQGATITSITPSQTTSTPSAASSTILATIVPITGNFQNVGLYSDDQNNRILDKSVRLGKGATGGNPGNGFPATVESCAETCKGYAYMGLKYGTLEKLLRR